MFEEYDKMKNKIEWLYAIVLALIIILIITMGIAGSVYVNSKKTQEEVEIEVQYDFYQLEVRDRVDRFDSEEGFYYNYLFVIVDTNTYFEVGYQKWFKDFDKYEKHSIVLVILVNGEIEDFILMENA